MTVQSFFMHVVNILPYLCALLFVNACALRLNKSAQNTSCSKDIEIVRLEWTTSQVYMSKSIKIQHWLYSQMPVTTYALNTVVVLSTSWFITKKQNQFEVTTQIPEQPKWNSSNKLFSWWLDAMHTLQWLCCSLYSDRYTVEPPIIKLHLKKLFM